MHFGQRTLLTNCHVATMAEGSDFGLIEEAAILIDGATLSWVGKSADAPRADEIRVADLGGRWVTPGLVDCHTHLVFGGNRADEFALRLSGASYEEIARAGGGIWSTVRATRASDEKTLLKQALPRLRSLARSGVTTVEVKSGYGLDAKSELKLLRTARRLEERGGVQVTTTFLGLHALPPEFAGRSDDYVDLVIDEILPAVAKEQLADAVDAYAEPIAFSVAQVERFFAAAGKLGLPVKLHADQLSPSGGAALAARYNALSADHLEYASEADAVSLAKAGVVPVLLPGAYLTLREERRPPIEAFRKNGAGMAIATDLNPGTSPLASLLVAMNLACTLFGLTPAEALQGATRHAAKALALQMSIGTIESGKSADLAVWDISHPSELAYWLGHSPLDSRYVRGRIWIS